MMSAVVTTVVTVLKERIDVIFIIVVCRFGVLTCGDFVKDKHTSKLERFCECSS